MKRTWLFLALAGLGMSALATERVVDTPPRDPNAIPKKGMGATRDSTAKATTPPPPANLSGKSKAKRPAGSPAKGR